MIATQTMTISEIECPGPRVTRDGHYRLGDALRRFRVLSPSGNTYVVAETVNDETCGDGILRTWSCTCPAGQHRKRCKHVNAVIAFVDAAEGREAIAAAEAQQA